VLLGEAPGADEAAAGRPFVGPAGKQLNQWLSIAGLDRQELFVTNSVKYRPTKSTGANRKPWKSELQVSTKYLVMELMVVRPKWIVALGSTALTMLWLDLLDPAPQISNVHGTELKVTGRYRPYRVFAMYHPAAVLHNESIVDVAALDARALGVAVRD
jgi:uracil-DNA glycosylase